MKEGRRIEPCWACGQLIDYWVDEDGTPRDIKPFLNEETLAVAINTAQIDPKEIRIGKDLTVIAKRILKALDRK